MSEYMEVARQMAPLFIAATVVILIIVLMMARLSEPKEEAPIPLILQQAAKAQAEKEEKKRKEKEATEAARLKKKAAAAAAASKVKLADRREVASVLKGHTGHVTGAVFSPNGKHLATISEDRTLRMWPIKDFGTKGVKAVQFNVELDHATSINFTEDGRACVVGLAAARRLRVLKVDIKGRSCENKGEVPEAASKPWPTDVLGCGIHAADPNNRGSGCTYVASATNGTKLEFRTIKGELMEEIDTKNGGTNTLTMSPDGRFVAICGYTGSAKVFAAPRVAGTKATRAFNCGAHTSAVYHCAFSDDTMVMATVSKDGSWKLWNINIEYDRGGDPKLMAEGRYDDRAGGAFIAVSPDKRVVAVVSGPQLTVFSVRTGEAVHTITDAHSGSRCTSVDFDAEGKYIATTATDKHVVVWHNTAGRKEAVYHLEKDLINASAGAMKDRIQEQLDEAKAAIAAATPQ